MGLIFQCQPFEEMFLVLENRLQRGQGKRLTETPRAGKEINAFGRLQQLPQAFRFVHVEEIPSYEVFKSIYAGRKFFISCIQIYS